jgi:hypothetical protein
MKHFLATTGLGVALLLPVAAQASFTIYAPQPGDSGYHGSFDRGYYDGGYYGASSYDPYRYGNSYNNNSYNNSYNAYSRSSSNSYYRGHTPVVRRAQFVPNTAQVIRRDASTRTVIRTYYDYSGRAAYDTVSTTMTQRRPAYQSGYNPYMSGYAPYYGY